MAALSEEDVELRARLLARLAGALRDERSRARRDKLSGGGRGARPPRREPRRTRSLCARRPPRRHQRSGYGRRVPSASRRALRGRRADRRPGARRQRALTKRTRHDRRSARSGDHAETEGRLRGAPTAGPAVAGSLCARDVRARGGPAGLEADELVRQAFVFGERGSARRRCARLSAAVPRAARLPGTTRGDRAGDRRPRDRVPHPPGVPLRTGPCPRPARTRPGGARRGG